MYHKHSNAWAVEKLPKIPRASRRPRILVKIELVCRIVFSDTVPTGLAVAIMPERSDLHLRPCHRCRLALKPPLVSQLQTVSVQRHIATTATGLVGSAARRRDNLHRDQRRGDSGEILTATCVLEPNIIVRDRCGRPPVLAAGGGGGNLYDCFFALLRRFGATDSNDISAGIKSTRSWMSVPMIGISS